MKKIIRKEIEILKNRITYLHGVKREALKEQDEKLYNETNKKLDKVYNDLNNEEQRLIKFLTS